MFSRLKGLNTNFSETPCMFPQHSWFDLTWHLVCLNKVYLGVYLLGMADLVYKLNFVESFAFGSLISAVDPVATLAIFQGIYFFSY